MPNVKVFTRLPHDARIYVAGHCGLVGSAIVRRLRAYGYNNLVLRTHAELDLIDQRLVKEFFRNEGIEFVFLCAAKVGGILYNSRHQADFLRKPSCPSQRLRLRIGWPTRPMRPTTSMGCSGGWSSRWQT